MEQQRYKMHGDKLGEIHGEITSQRVLPSDGGVSWSLDIATLTLTRRWLASRTALAVCRKAGYRPDLAWTCCDYADTPSSATGLRIANRPCS